MKFVDLWYSEVGVCNIPFLVFRNFFRGGHFENAPGEGVHHKFSLLTLQILILYAVSLQKNISL